MKYYQQSFAKLAENMTDQEKDKIKKELRNFIIKHDYFCKAFNSLPKNEQEWIIDYMSTGKGVIPYEMIISFDYLNITPTDEDFFKIEDFHSSFKNSIISEEKYDSVKKFYMLMKMRNLGDLNMIYNFQDTIILCEIFESRAIFLNDKFKVNPRKCNSASSFSECVQSDKSKFLIAAPTNSEHVLLFEKTYMVVLAV